jgi:hypothetical protein
MSNWDSEGHAAKMIKKIFAPRKSYEYTITNIDELGIENFEYFSDSHFPDVSSTELRKKIPEYT